MLKNALLWGLIASGFLTGGCVATAKVIAESGDWRAFQQNNSCAIGIGHNQSFTLLYFSEQDAFALDVTESAPWNFAGHNSPAIKIQIDGHRILSKSEGVTKDNVLQFVLTRLETTLLLAGISAGNRMSLDFPYSDNRGGFVNLSGSRTAALAFAKCVSSIGGNQSSGDSNQTSTSPTFDFSFDSFRAALDNEIREDVLAESDLDANTTKGCHQIGDTYSCTFHDAGFQTTVANFKKLDIMNGRFTLKLKLDVDTISGKVSRIMLSGDRGDPVNLFQFIGTAVDIMRTFDPAVGKADGESKQIADDLGLMRGDDAEDINEVRTLIKPYAEIGCLTQDSNVTTSISCQFLPRS